MIGASSRRDPEDFLWPIGCALVVVNTHSKGPNFLTRSSFSSLPDVIITHAPSAADICAAKIETPPVPCASTVSPAFKLPSFTSVNHAVKAAMGRVEASASLKYGHGYSAFLRQNSQLSQHTGKGSAQSGHHGRRTWSPVQPLLPELPHNAVPDPKPGDRFTDGDDFARSVGNRHEGQFHMGVVIALEQIEIAVIQRDCRNFSRGLSWAGLRIRPLGKSQMFKAKLRQFPNLHTLPFFRDGRENHKTRQQVGDQQESEAGLEGVHHAPK